MGCVRSDFAAAVAVDTETVEVMNRRKSESVVFMDGVLGSVVGWASGRSWDAHNYSFRLSSLQGAQKIERALDATIHIGRSLRALEHSQDERVRRPIGTGVVPAKRVSFDVAVQRLKPELRPLPQPSPKSFNDHLSTAGDASPRWAH